MTADREIVVDSFAGGGGASLGIAWALGRGPDVAINHEPAAILMHEANHPTTKHYTEDVFSISPRKVTKGRPVGLLWSSPDCKHFSRAKGSKPVNKNIRGLAWVVVKWAAEVGPRVIILENVREFQDWGPLVPAWKCAGCKWTGTEGQAKLAGHGKRACPRCDSRKLSETEEKLPDPARKGLTFKQFVGRLKAKGYAVEWKVLNAADYGAPTHRRRLFLVARNDGQPIVWPDPTHGDPKKIGHDLFSADLKPWRTAAECIDWSIPCPSIFDRKKPLAEKTLRRIALGIKRYVLDNPKPFLVRYNTEKSPTENNAHPVSAPFNTITADPRFGVVSPVVSPLLVDNHRDNRTRTPAEPLGTVTTQGNKFNVVSPVIVPVTHAGERRTNGPEEPLPTVTGANRGELALTEVVFEHLCETEAGDFLRQMTGGRKRCKVCGKMPQPKLAAPVITRIGQTGGNGSYSYSPTDPLTTITSKAEHLVVAPTLMPHYGRSTSTTVEKPLPTVTAGGMGKQVLIAPTLVQSGYGERDGQAPRALDIEAPLGTVVAGGTKHALCAAFLAKHYGGVVGVPADTPLPTTTARGTQNQLAVANLVHLNHGDKTASGLNEPGRTVTAGGNHAALVYSFLTKYFKTGVGQPVDAPLHTVTTNDRFGLVTVTIDGEPFVIVDIGMRMLKPRELARGQGFAESYVLTGTATNQVERIGNSVPPHLALAMVAANYTPEPVGVAA